MKQVLLSTAMIVATMVSGQVLIDDTNTVETPTAGAVLDLNSEDKGLLLPRLGVTQVNDDMKQEGMVFYDANGKCFKGWDGTNWQVLGDDCLPPTEFDLVISITEPGFVSEGESQTFEVSLDPAIQPGVEITVDYTTVDGTATAGDDYTTVNGTLTFNEANPGPLLITVPTLSDGELEAPEIYNVTLSNAQATGFGVADIVLGTAIGTIIDDLYVVPPTLIISEYIEGSGNNKYLELYNATSETISLAGYDIQNYQNGNNSATHTTSLNNAAGLTELAPGGILVIKHQSGDAIDANGAPVFENSNICSFNGNDVVALRHNEEIIDQIGEIGVNPGNNLGWTVNDVSNATYNNGLRRLSTITTGNTDWTSSAATEWTVADQNDVSNLGSR